MQLQDYIDLTEPELYVVLGRDLSAGHALPSSPDEASRVGRNVFIGALPLIRQVVCGNSAVASIRDETTVLRLATRLVDLLTPLFGTPPVFSIAVLIAKMGLDKLCEADDDPLAVS
jgi:hypothetical protein